MNLDEYLWWYQIQSCLQSIFIFKYEVSSLLVGLLCVIYVSILNNSSRLVDDDCINYLSIFSLIIDPNDYFFNN